MLMIALMKYASPMQEKIGISVSQLTELLIHQLRNPSFQLMP